MILKRYIFYMRNSISNEKKIIVKHSSFFSSQKMHLLFSKSLCFWLKYSNILKKHSTSLISQF